jgi:hypothetical protein
MKSISNGSPRKARKLGRNFGSIDSLLPLNPSWSSWFDFILIFALSGYGLGTFIMRQRLKQYFLIALAAAALYFVLDNHFIFKKNRFYLLRKADLNLHDTFVSLDNKRPETIMESEDLRDAGIGELMVDLGMMTDDERQKLESKFAFEE